MFLNSQTVKQHVMLWAKTWKRSKLCLRGTAIIVYVIVKSSKLNLDHKGHITTFDMLGRKCQNLNPQLKMTDRKWWQWLIMNSDSDVNELYIVILRNLKTRGLCFPVWVGISWNFQLISIFSLDALHQIIKHWLMQAILKYMANRRPLLTKRKAITSSKFDRVDIKGVLKGA